MTGVVKAHPSDSELYTFTWDDLPAGVSLASVVHTPPSPLVKGTESTDTVAGTSTCVISGGVHGGWYVIDAVATLSNGRTRVGQFLLRVFNG